MKLTGAMPRWDRRERHRVPCDVPAADVMSAAEEVTWREVPVFRDLMSMMPLGRPRLAADEPASPLRNRRPAPRWRDGVQGRPRTSGR